MILKMTRKMMSQNVKISHFGSIVLPLFKFWVKIKSGTIFAVLSKIVPDFNIFKKTLICEYFTTFCTLAKIMPKIKFSEFLAK